MGYQSFFSLAAPRPLHGCYHIFYCRYASGYYCSFLGPNNILKTAVLHAPRARWQKEIWGNFPFRNFKDLSESFMNSKMFYSVSVDQSLPQRYLLPLLNWIAHDDQPPHPQRRPRWSQQILKNGRKHIRFDDISSSYRHSLHGMIRNLNSEEFSSTSFSSPSNACGLQIWDSF